MSGFHSVTPAFNALVRPGIPMLEPYTCWVQPGIPMLEPYTCWVQPELLLYHSPYPETEPCLTRFSHTHMENWNAN